MDIFVANLDPRTASACWGTARHGLYNTAGSAARRAWCRSMSAVPLECSLTMACFWIAVAALLSGLAVGAPSPQSLKSDVTILVDNDLQGEPAPRLEVMTETRG